MHTGAEEEREIILNLTTIWELTEIDVFNLFFCLIDNVNTGYPQFKGVHFSSIYPDYLVANSGVEDVRECEGAVIQTGPKTLTTT